MTDIEVALPFWLDRPDHEATDVALAAADTGFAALWIGEMATYDAFALATSIGLRTPNMTLKVGPLAVGVRGPVGLALGVSSVASLTGCRVDLALGASSPAIVAGWHGRPWAHHVPVMRETIECLRSIFTGARVEYSGRHVNSRGFRLRGAAPDTRIALGAFGPGMIRLAAQHADEVVLNLASPFRVGRVRAAIDSAAAAAGRAAPRRASRCGCRSPSTPVRPRTPSWQLSWRCTSPRPAMAKCSARWVSTAWSVARGPGLLAANWRSLSPANCSTGCVRWVAPIEWRPGSAPTRMPVPIASRSCPPPLKTRGAGWLCERCDPAGSTAPLATTTADGNLDRDGGVAMSGGLFGLLDHVAVLARLAAASIDDIGAAAGRATAKAAGVVIDDTAVTPQYVHRITAERELPIIKRIAIGSVRNKLLLILPGALLLSQLVPWLLTPLLMLGATYLCYEGAEKVCGVIGGRGHDAAPQVAERELVAGAIRTDFILSAEIMVIALNEVADQPFVPRLIVLVIVALVITAAVYGVVAVIVQMDDVGLRLTQTASRFGQRIGGGLVAGMPKLLSALSAVGMGAMLWVGGHIVLVGSDHLGWHAPYRLVHHLDDHLVGSAGGALTWLVSTAACAATGLVIGIVVVALVHLVCFRPPRSRSL
ncbi:integral membrane protein [Mycobacterium tuberculosis]|nr:integral membrane protein [Mycobacterium tuberculosis]CCG12974.1 putative CONSERVED INTEGRAL membrane protein [Mycobacterium tuberculosis 7199-99]KXN94359.1 PF05661 family protein [Mycobacterium tuberculosis]OMH56973.1 Inner membrane protein YedI [Mycobacterium tuberculosis]OMH61037.1 Inner membrane protein YedI [Mycobacterium tuberculosis]